MRTSISDCDVLPRLCKRFSKCRYEFVLAVIADFKLAHERRAGTVVVLDPAAKEFSETVIAQPQYGQAIAAAGDAASAVTHMRSGGEEWEDGCQEITT
jgi:hypothetical protein